MNKMKTKVYFNNSCSICRTEINEYKKNSDEKIEWIEVNNLDKSDRGEGGSASTGTK